MNDEPITRTSLPCPCCGNPLHECQLGSSVYLGICMFNEQVSGIDRRHDHDFSLFCMKAAQHLITKHILTARLTLTSEN